MCEIDIKEPKLYSELIKSIPEDEREIVNVMNRQSAEAQQERLSRLQHEEWEKKHNLRTVYSKIQWTDKGPLKNPVANSVSDAIYNAADILTVRIIQYVESQIKDFLKENKIPEKRWLKRGVIQSLPPELSSQSYILYYKTWRREIKRKITVNYNIIIN